LRARGEFGDLRGEALTDEVPELRRRFDRRDDYVELDKRVTALEELLRTR
jgi:hypothetical protein